MPMKRAVHILFLTSCWPEGEAFGGQIRAVHVGRALTTIGDVTVAVVSQDAAAQGMSRKSAAEFRTEQPVIVNTVRNCGLVQRLRWALDTRYLNVHGCLADTQDRARI